MLWTPRAARRFVDGQEARSSAKMTNRAIIAAGVASVGLLFAAAPKPAHAEIEYPWCGYMSVFQGQQQSCSFNTLEQCRAWLGGNGYCDTNPRGPLARTPTSPLPPTYPPVRRR